MGHLWARSKEAREEANPPIAPLEFCIFPKKKRKREKRKIDKKRFRQGTKEIREDRNTRETRHYKNNLQSFI